MTLMGGGGAVGRGEGKNLQNEDMKEEKEKRLVKFDQRYVT